MHVLSITIPALIMGGVTRRSPKLLPQTPLSSESDGIKQFDIKESNIETTPLVIDRIIVMTADARHVLALDAKAGELIWEYRRPMSQSPPREYGQVKPRTCGAWQYAVFRQCRRVFGRHQFQDVKFADGIEVIANSAAPQPQAAA
jgi:hypothetical protein